MATAPWVAAYATAVVRSAQLLVFASTRRMWQCGHMAATIWTSRSLSSAQPALEAYDDGLWPSWPIWVKHPGAVTGQGSPVGYIVDRYVLRSSLAYWLW